jgi:aconitase B
MLEVYREYLDQRSAVGITSLSFETEQTAASVELLKTLLLGAVNS